jgi:PPM family protein phosphatase
LNLSISFTLQSINLNEDGESMRSAWKSDPGLVRENNEDAVRVDEANGIFLLADGMGGGPGGEVASELAVSAAFASLVRHLPGHDEGTRGRLLAEALAAAHSAVAKRALGDPSLQGMGTTLEIVYVHGAEAVICHLGDSRVYLFRRGALRQVTTDDNYAAVLAASGKISPERIPAPYRHILTQAVGASEELVPEIHTLALEPGDLLLVCSDGLTEALTDGEIEALMGLNRAEFAALPQSLVAAANDKGGPDNVSVIVVEPLPASPAPTLLLPAPPA